MPELFTKAKDSRNSEVSVFEPYRDGLTENNADLERVIADDGINTKIQWQCYMD